MSSKMLRCIFYYSLLLHGTFIEWGIAAKWNYLPSSKLMASKIESEDIKIINSNSLPNYSDSEDENMTFDSTSAEVGKTHWELSNKEISEICGTVSSLKCGNEVLRKKSANSKAYEIGGLLNEKCKLREEFLHCIDFQRRTCKTAAGNHILPLLPPKPIINKLQENVWKALWTSGGCVLGT